MGNKKKLLIEYYKNIKNKKKVMQIFFNEDLEEYDESVVIKEKDNGINIKTKGELKQNIIDAIVIHKILKDFSKKERSDFFKEIEKLGTDNNNLNIILSVKEDEVRVKKFTPHVGWIIYESIIETTKERDMLSNIFLKALIEEELFQIKGVLEIEKILSQKREESVFEIIEVSQGKLQLVIKGGIMETMSSIIKILEINPKLLSTVSASLKLDLQSEDEDLFKKLYNSRLTQFAIIAKTTYGSFIEIPMERDILKAIAKDFDETEPVEIPDKVKVIIFIDKNGGLVSWIHDRKELENKNITLSKMMKYLYETHKD